MEKKRRKNKSDYGENFIPPDGGWGWVVCIASGMSNICTFPIFQQFGLIFRDKLLGLGLSNKEITSIINTHHGITALSGFFNGPLFRRFSYRQLAIVGSLILIFGVYLTTYASSFLLFITIYSVFLGIGKGLNLTAKQFAFLTYFKKNRRRGISYISTIAGLGPIVMPYVVTFLMSQYGINGTLLIFCGIAMHTLLFSLVYQPVLWHVKKIPPEIELNEKCEYCNILDENDLTEFSIETDNKENIKNGQCKCVETKKLINSPQKNNNNIVDENQEKEKLSLWQKIVSFLDLNLLKDFTFLNLSFGITCTLFVERNFNILMPFFLSDFGYTTNQITLAMSLPRIPDVLMRFLTPYVVRNLNWQNRTFWVICVTGMTIGEIIIAQNPSFEIIFVCLIANGIFRGGKTVFTGMIIPDYVPLAKIPAAMGLHRLISGSFMLAWGPIVGMIRDESNYSMALMFLNILSILPITLWSIDLYRAKFHRKKVENQIDDTKYNITKKPLSVKSTAL